MLKDLRYALRMLVKNPGFTVVTVLCLAVGIGANTTVFCWIQSTLLHAIPEAQDPGRLVVLSSTRGASVWHGVSYPDIQDLGRATQVFAGVIGSQVTPACLKVDGKPEWIYGQIATANFFEVLGVRPVVGRTFLPEEELKPGGHPVMVLSHGFWQRRFGGDPKVVGRVVELNRHSFTIVGVGPPGFQGTMGGLMCDFWAPITMHQQVANFGSLTSRADRWLHTQARLQAGVSRRQAQVAVTLLAEQLAQAYPDSNREVGIKVLPVWNAPYGGQAALMPALRILAAVSAIVLLIVAANVANLLLARAASRRKEIAVRLAMGARRGRLIRQLLTESLLLALVGGAVGVGIAWVGTGLLAQLIPPTYLPVGYNFAMDGQTLVFTLVLTVLTALVFGLAPAWQVSGAGFGDALKEGGRSPSGGATHHRLRRALVVGEIGLALLLLIGAGLCLQGFKKAQQVEIGFNPNGVLLAGLRVGMHGYTEETATSFYRNLRERLATVPGVESVGLASWFPLGFEGGPSLRIQPEGYAPEPGEDLNIPYSIVSPGLLRTLQIRLVEGRDFTDRDDRSAPGVAIINQAMAERYWPGQHPIGRKFRYWRGQREATVVGLVATGKYHRLDEPPQPFFYLPYTQGVWDLNLGVCLRTTSSPLAMVGAVRQQIRSLDPGVEVWANIPMPDFVQAVFLAHRIAATLLVLLSGVALGLAVMGIYGVMAYVVSQRTREIGIRMALGAQSRHVLRLVLGEGLALAVLGVGVGMVAALAATRWLAAFLYGVSPFDAVTFLGIAAGLTLVTLAASYVPARRAIRVDPIVALRWD